MKLDRKKYKEIRVINKHLQVNDNYPLCKGDRLGVVDLKEEGLFVYLELDIFPPVGVKNDQHDHVYAKLEKEIFNEIWLNSSEVIE